MRKNQVIYTRLIYFFIIIFSIYSCSESENEDLNIDTSLFYGKWYSRERCATNNYKIYGENNEYTNRFSLNENCNINTFDVKESNGTYNLKGNEITYGNEGNIEIIIEGTNDVSVSDEINFEFYIERITEINEQQMTIEIESKISGITNKRITYLYKNPN